MCGDEFLSRPKTPPFAKNFATCMPVTWTMPLLLDHLPLSAVLAALAFLLLRTAVKKRALSMIIVDSLFRGSPKFFADSYFLLKSNLRHDYMVKAHLLHKFLVDVTCRILIKMDINQWLIQCPGLAEDMYIDPRFRATLMTQASLHNQLSLLILLTDLEVRSRPKRVGKQSAASCYDLVHPDGNCSPAAFCASSSEAVEILLRAGLPEMRLTDPAREDMPLLHFCIARGLLNDFIADNLHSQAEVKWKGLLAWEYAMFLGDLSTFARLRKRHAGNLLYVLDEQLPLTEEKLGLFNGVGREKERCAMYKILVNDPRNLYQLRQFRRRVVFECCRGEHCDLFDLVVDTLEVSSEDLEGPPGRVSPLWVSANNGDAEFISRLARRVVDAVLVDRPAPDGTTAFAVAMGNRHVEVVKLMLESPAFGPKKRFRFLAQEFLKADEDEGDRKTTALKVALRDMSILHEEQKCDGRQPDRCATIVESSLDYPYLNENAESSWSYNANFTDSMDFAAVYHVCSFANMRCTGCRYPNLENNQLCIRSPKRTWFVNDDVTIDQCKHNEEERRISCSIIHDLVAFSRTLEHECRESGSLLKDLQPRFTLVGSVAEGTRVGLGNEIDLMIDFQGLEDSEDGAAPFEVHDDDPRHLFAIPGVLPSWMEEFIGEHEEFQLEKLNFQLLEGLDAAIQEIYKSGKNPPGLERVTPNEVFRSADHTCADCQERRRNLSDGVFVQCARCAVTVSQTKAGVCLQFQWRSPSSGAIVYCSMDLVPTFRIEPMDATRLARIVNTAMLSAADRGWFRHLKNYTKCDRVIGEIEQEGNGLEIESVFLKTLQDTGSYGYYVRPGQLLGREKFRDDKHKYVYYHIKYLKKLLLDADDVLSLYMIKKLLWKPSLLVLLHGTVFQEEFLLKVLMQPELRRKFERRIDFATWERRAGVEGFLREIPLLQNTN